MPAGLPDFQQTVPRWQVHRRAVSEVFVCESRATAPDEFTVSVQLPRAHLLWSDCARGYHDCLMAVEAGRQALIMLCHAHYGIAADTVMTARSATMRVYDREAFRDDGTTPLEGAFVLRLAGKAMQRGRPVSMTFEGDLLLAGTKAMTMTGTLVFTRKEDYEFLRAQSRVRKQLDAPARARREPLAAVPPALVGRRVPGNVVIAGEPSPARPAEAGSRPAEAGGHLARHVIVVDQANPCFFDHPLDHVPGQLLMEACRQSAIVTAVRDRVLPGPDCIVTACRLSFDDFVELDALADCTVTEVSRADTGTAGTARMRVSVQQLGMRVGDVELELTALSDPGRLPSPARQPAQG